MSFRHFYYKILNLINEFFYICSKLMHFFTSFSFKIFNLKIHLSNLMIEANGVATRTGRKLDDNGKLVRFSKKSGEVIK